MSDKISYQEIVTYLRETTGDINWYLNNKIGQPVAHRRFPPLTVQRHVTEAAVDLRQVRAYLSEKLTKGMSAGDVIHDFIHSDDPKFKGKTKKERQKMALGAYYSMHPELKREEIEKIVEGKMKAKHTPDSPKEDDKGMSDYEHYMAHKEKHDKKKEKDEEHAGHFAHAARKSAAAGKTTFTIGGTTYPVKANPNVKEEVEQVDEATISKKMHAWGKMITVHDGSHQSFPLHPEHQEKIKNLKNGEKTTFTDETNSKIHAHREGDIIHLKHANAKVSSRVISIPYHHFTEEVEQNESVGTNRSVEMPHSFDVIVHDQNGKEVKVHKGVKALNKKHAETKVKYKHPEGHTFTAHMNEEVDHVYENNDSHTHAAHFENDKGEWSGMQLFSAKDDEDAIKKAHELAKKHGKLTSVEKHVPIKEVASQEELDEILDESFALDEAKTKEQREAERAARNARMAGQVAAMHGKMSTKLQRRVGVAPETSVAKAKKAHLHQASSIAHAAAVAHPEKAAKTLRQINAERVARAMTLGKAHQSGGVGGGGSGPANVSPLEKAMSKVAEKSKKGAGASPAEVEAEKMERKKAEVQKAHDEKTKKLTGRDLEEGFVGNVMKGALHSYGQNLKTKLKSLVVPRGIQHTAKTVKRYAHIGSKLEEELNTDMTDDHEGNKKKDKLKKVGKKQSKLKRKYLGKNKGRTATGQPAHKVDCEPSIKDAKV